ncbi:MAG: hypothetical protein ACU843_06840 [Gammaproteobacteria bacterium]
MAEGKAWDNHTGSIGSGRKVRGLVLRHVPDDAGTRHAGGLHDFTNALMMTELNEGKTTARGNILLLLGSILFCLVILLIAEWLTRAWSDIVFLGNSRNLFAPAAFGTSRGNAKNVEALSFGAPVFTDEYGFRIPRPGSAHNSVPKRETILILGDSVAFGPGLDEPQTFSGMLREGFPDLEIYNSAVIGYSTRDYRNVVDYFLSSNIKINRVFLLFCLNDLSTVSAREIEQRIEPGTKSQGPTIQTGQGKPFVEALKSFTAFEAMNDFLRSNSKFYLLLKGILTDPQARYWSADSRLYGDANHAQFLSGMDDIEHIAAALRRNRVALTVILAPFEYQLRNPDLKTRLPQTKLTEFFAEHSIESIDSIPSFIAQEAPSQAFFLAYDPMHFSEKGHRVIFGLIVDRMGLSKMQGN